MVLVAATTAAGIEDCLAADGAEAGAKVAPALLDYPGRAWFEVADETAAAGLLHGLRTAHRVGIVLSTAEVDPAGGVELLPPALLAGAPFERWLTPDRSFAVRARRRGQQRYNRLEVERRVGGALHDALAAGWGRAPRVDLDDPDVLFRVDLDPAGRAVLWVDLVGRRSLHQRGYRLHPHRAPMKGTIACAVLRLVGFAESEGVLVDPMCGGGTFGIEAAAWRAGLSPLRLRNDLLAARSPRFPDGPPPPPPPAGGPLAPIVLRDRNARHVEGARWNAEAAGVADRLRFETGDVAGLPQSVEEARFVVANPPYGFRIGGQDVPRSYRDLLASAAAILEPGGRLGITTTRVDLVEAHAAESGLAVLHRRDVAHGDLTVRILVLGRD